MASASVIQFLNHRRVVVALVVVVVVVLFAAITKPATQQPSNPALMNLYANRRVSMFHVIMAMIWHKNKAAQRRKKKQ